MTVRILIPLVFPAEISAAIVHVKFILTGMGIKVHNDFHVRSAVR